MNRYFSAAIRAATGILKFSVLKTFRYRSFSSTAMNLISPGTEITLDKGGKLFIGKLMKMRGGSILRVRRGAIVSIGDHFNMGNHCMITAYQNVTIGNDVMFGPGVLVYDHDHDFKAEGGVSAQKYKTAPVKIGNNVWIGANTIILRGTTIGDNCVVGAGSIIKGRFPANSLIIQKRTTDILEY